MQKFGGGVLDAVLDKKTGGSRTRSRCALRLSRSHMRRSSLSELQSLGGDTTARCASRKKKVVTLPLRVSRKSMLPFLFLPHEELVSLRVESCVGPCLDVGREERACHMMRRRADNVRSRRNDPERYWDAVLFLNSRIEEDQSNMRELASCLSDRGGIAQYRLKSASSLIRKARIRNLALDELRDRAGVRGVFPSSLHLSAAAQFVEETQNVVSKKDYVLQPKTNGYASIHYMVLSPNGRETELQLRTREMHRVATLGSAAHWRYKLQQGLRAEVYNQFRNPRFERKDRTPRLRADR